MGRGGGGCALCAHDWWEGRLTLIPQPCSPGTLWPEIMGCWEGD